jgi:hypothetical protein
MKLRKALFGHFYPDPKEGTNTAALENGWKLKGVYKIDRKVLVEAIPATREAMEKIGVNIDTLIEWDPSLKISAYRALSDATKSIFDKVLLIKPGAPSLELAPPPTTKGS